MAASRQSASRSAPTKPWVMAARWARSTSAASGIPRLWISRISLRPSRSGIEMAISRSNRPGRRSAGIQRVRQVGRRQHDHVLAPVEPVHQGQQLGDDPLLDVADDPLAVRGDGVDLVEEDDAGRLPRRLLEDLAEMGLALAVELVDDLRAVDREELGVGLVGHGAGDQRLAAAGRPVQQHALGRVDAQPLEDLPDSAAAARRSRGCGAARASGRRYPRKRAG